MAVLTCRGEQGIGEGGLPGADALVFADQCTTLNERQVRQGLRRTGCGLCIARKEGEGNERIKLDLHDPGGSEFAAASAV